MSASTDMPDDEIRTRLLQQGMHPAVIDNLIVHRGDPEYDEIIDGLLD